MRILWLATGSAVATGLVLVLAACSHPPGGPSPLFRLEGTVVDGNLTLPDVEVSLVGRSLVTHTDSAGAFKFDGLPQGLIQLRFRKEGYADQTEQVDITANTQRTFDLARSRAGSGSGSGPFRLEGIVTDGGFYLPGVEVSVIEGTGRGLVTQTIGFGAFTLEGVQGQIQLRLRKQGYPEQIEQVDVTVDTRRGFSLGRDAARPDYAGTYALTISAAASCAAAIPQRRTYVATIAPDSANGRGRINVSLSGADFVANRFPGVVDPSGGIIFSFGNSDVYSDFSLDEVIERLGTVELVIGGVATTTGSPQRISGPFAGTLGTVADAGTSPRTYLAECKSEGHTLEMVRQ